MATEALPATVLVVDAEQETDALREAGDVLRFEGVDAATQAIKRIEESETVDVVLLGPRLSDPVRVAQRVHSLDRLGSVVILVSPEREAEVRHALEVAPFLEGDIACVAVGDADVEQVLAAAAQRSRSRREAAEERRRRRESPPPLSARYLGTLLDSAPIGIVTLDASGAVIGWNKRAGEMLGVPEVEALGRQFGELWPESERTRLDELIESLAAGGLDAGSEAFERDAQAFEISGARFKIRSGESGSILVLQDVTQRVSAERELLLQKALLEAQAETSDAGIAVVSIDGRLELINRRFVEIWGVDADTIRNDPERARSLMRAQVVDDEAFMSPLGTFKDDPERDHRDELRLRDGRIIARFGTIAHGPAGQMVGRVWFHTDITERRRNEAALRFLTEATDLLYSSLDYETSLRRVAELAVPRLADRCEIDLTPEDRAGITEDHRLVVPMRAREKPLGVITLSNDESGRVFDDEDVGVAEELARRAAIAIDNATVYDELRSTSRILQESLLPPHLPAIDGVDVAARFRPAGIGLQVGGDFYDVFPIAEKRWGVAIGDVCGKGADAASLTALTRYTARAAAMYEQSASGVLRVLNEALVRQRDDYRFTTLAYCVLDLHDRGGTMQVACGGHPPPIVLRADSTAAAVDARGPLLGVMLDAEFTDVQIELEAGDTVVLYTDGLTDAQAPTRILSEADLFAELERARSLAASDLAERLEGLATTDGAEPRDDVALIVLRLAG